MINFFSENGCRVRHIKKVRGWISKVVSSENKNEGELNIILVSKEEILRINNSYLNHNYHTDIITFNYNEGKVINGDIYICTDVVKENAKDYNQKINDELHRVIIHGILHLIGYKDNTDDEKLEMRLKENKALKFFPI